MVSISLPLQTLTLDVTSFLSAHPSLIYDLAGHGVAHALYSHARRRRHGKGNRRVIRKESNRRRRWFVDNIIMHHKRLHDRNRETVINDARKRAIARRDAMKKESLNLQKTTPQKGPDQMKWRNAVNLKDKGSELRGRADSRRMRARSRWLAISENKN